MKEKLFSVLKQNIFMRLDYGYYKNQFDYFRLVISLFSLFHFASFLLDYKVFLAPNGIVNWEVTNASAFWFEPHLIKISQLFHLENTTVLVVFSTFYIINLMLLALGLFTRFTSIAVFGAFLMFSVQLYPFLYGVDLYLSVCLLMLCIFPSGYALSLKPKSINDKIVNQQQIGMRGIQAYLAVTYLSAGLGKAKMASWLNGEFLFSSISDPNYQLFPFPTGLHYAFYMCLGIFVIITEMFYFILIFIPYVRTLLLFSIIGMHLFIALFMGLVPFGLLLALINIVAWYPLIVSDFKNIHKFIRPHESFL
jgi:hypothetical protein